MQKKIKILIVSCSPRNDSKSYRVVLHLYEKLRINKDYNIEILDVREADFPQFESVYDSIEKVPNHLKSIANKIFNSDTYIIVTPEYNGTYTAELQNLFDRFPRQKRKVYGIVTVSSGSMGGIRASQQLFLYLNALMGIVSPNLLIVPNVEKTFNEKGIILNDFFISKVDTFLIEFKWLLNRINLN